PPTPTLFPYTTLFRSHDHADADHTDTDWADDTVDRVAVPDRAISRGIVDGDPHTRDHDAHGHDGHDRRDTDANVDTNAGARHIRSEEHTSELQSRFDL